jgi:hypothetical protein
MGSMNERDKRMRNIFFGAVPNDGPELDKIKKIHQEQVAADPGLKKEFKKKFEKAKNSALVQNENGIDVNIDREIRHFLREFNNRAWYHGLRRMPLMFNILESFFSYDRSIIFFELLEEEDYLISLFDFLDFYTSAEFDGSPESIKDNLQEDLIYNFNAGADVSDLTFSSDDGVEFVIGGVSLVRRKYEVTVLLQVGEITDTAKKTEVLRKRFNWKPIPGKEHLVPHPELPIEAVQLNDNPNYWKALVACRFDLDTLTIDGKYMARDLGNSFEILTNEIDGFLNAKGEFITPALKETFAKNQQEIERYNAIFEFAKACLHLPFYFNSFDSEVLTEEHSTGYKGLVRSPLDKRKFSHVDDRLKVSSRTLWILDRGKKFSGDRLIIRDDQFHVENAGYWKKLSADEFGTDKKGDRISGKTWVNRKDSYFRSKKAEQLVVKKNSKSFTGKNAGYIYVMRNPTMQFDTFKIGLTTGEPDDRADQLSKTSVPEKFYVMRQWAVKDCKLAEKQIHTLLKNYRVDPRREFFTLDMQEINSVIDSVVASINEVN